MAIGSVNEIQIDNNYRASRIAILKPSLTHTPIDAYIAYIAKGDAVTKALLAARGREERYYRYPYLETRTTPADCQKFEVWLAEHGYKVAPVSMENNDWEFAEPHTVALGQNLGGRSAQITPIPIKAVSRL